MVLRIDKAAPLPYARQLSIMLAKMISYTSANRLDGVEVKILSLLIVLLTCMRQMTLTIMNPPH